MESAKCRLCLGTLGGSRRCLWECSFRSAIDQVFWFKITPAEGLPSYACRQCCSFVRKFHKYGLKVQKNQTEFRKELTDTHLLSVEHGGGYESTSELEESLRLSSSDDEDQDEADSLSCDNQTTASDTPTEESQWHTLHEKNNRKTRQDSPGSNGSKSSLADNERLDKTYQQEDESDLNSSEEVSVEVRAPKRKYFTRSVQQAKRAKQSKQPEAATDVNANVEEKSTTAGATETWHSGLLLAYAVASVCDNSSEMEISVQENKDLVHTVKDEASTDIVEVVQEDRKGLFNLVNVKLESDDLVSGAEKALSAIVPLPADVGNHYSEQTSHGNNDMQTKARCKANSATVQNESTGERSKPKGKTKKKKREKICTSFADIWREFSKYCTGTLLPEEDIDRCKKSASRSQRDSRRASSKKSRIKSKATAVRAGTASRHVSEESSKQSVEKSSDEDKIMRTYERRNNFQESFEESAYSDACLNTPPGCQVQDAGNDVGHIPAGELNKVLYSNSNEGSSQDSKCSFNKLNPGDAIEEPIDVESYNAREASVTARHLRDTSKHQSRQSVTKTKATQRSKNSSSFRDILTEFAFPNANTADDKADQAFSTNTADNDVENGSIRCGSISSELLLPIDEKTSTPLDKL